MFRHYKSGQACGLVLALGCIVAADEFDMLRHSTDAGGATSSAAGAFTLDGTIGQADAARLTGGQYELDGGLWFAVAAGDCDVDGVVGLFDFATFAACAEQSDGLSGECGCIDFDGDGDVDLLDYGAFQAAFNAS